MTRLLPVLLLVAILIPAFSLPATLRADDIYSETECPVIEANSTLPVTGITTTTAVFNGSFCISAKGTLNRKLAADSFLPWVFEYGTAPGVYPYQVEPEIVSSETEIWINGKLVDPRFFTPEDIPVGKSDFFVKDCEIFRASVKDLDPCQTYYVRFKFNYPPPDEPCLEFRQGEPVKFTTRGCDEVESHGTGGMGAGTPTLRPYIPSNIVVQSASMAATKASPGENVDVAATITNRGGSNGTSKITLFINGQEAESKGITLTSGESAQVHFSVSRNDPGTYSVYVNGVPAGTLTVDLFTNNDVLIYGVIGLFTIGIIGVLYLVMRKRAA